MKNQYVVTRELYHSWIMKQRFQGIALVMFVLWCLVILVYLGLLILNIVLQQYAQMIFSAVILLVAIWFAFFRYPVYAKEQYDRLVKTFGTENWVRTIEFTEEEIVLTDGTSTIRYRYSAVVCIEETNTVVFLKLSNKALLPLYLDAFVDTDWSTCRQRIEEKRVL